MLHHAKNLRGYVLHALDGEIGHVADMYFDDENWTCRYLVVDTGNWLAGRTVLIAQPALIRIHDEARKFDVALTRQQVENAPDVNTHQPLSRQWETEHFDYYGWPYYWAAGGALGALVVPPIPLMMEEDKDDKPPAPTADSHLQSMNDVRGYHIAAHDGDIGHVDDLLLDDDDWHVRYFVVDTGNWWPGRKVLLAPQWVLRLAWSEARVYVDLDRAQIAEAPTYDPHTVPSRSYEDELWRHYGHAGYWHRQEKCREVMTVAPVCCRVDDWVDLAAELMKDVRVGALPVVQDYRRKQLVGMLTSHDIAERVTAAGRDPRTVYVRDVMTHNPVLCHPDDDLQVALNAMDDCHIHRIPVVDGDGKVVGVIARTDAQRSHLLENPVPTPVGSPDGKLDR